MLAKNELFVEIQRGNPLLSNVELPYFYYFITEPLFFNRIACLAWEMAGIYHHILQGLFAHVFFNPVWFFFSF